MLVLDKINNFKNMIQYYEGWLNAINMLRPNNTKKDIKGLIKSYMTNPLSMTLSNIMNLSRSLLALEQEQLDVIKGSPNTADSSKMKNIQDKILSEVNVFNKIQVYPGKTGTDADVFFQLRNALAHGNFSCSINKYYFNEQILNWAVNDMVVNIDNGKIHGQITYEELQEILRSYECASDAMGFRKLERFIPVQNDFEKVVFTATKCEGQEGFCINAPQFIYENYKSVMDEDIVHEFSSQQAVLGNNTFDASRGEITNHEKQQLEQIKRFIGEERWKNLSAEYKYRLANDYILSTSHKKTQSVDRMINGFRYLGNVDNERKKFNMEEIYYLEAPLFYSNFMIEYAFYCFDYAREINGKEATNIFYHENISLDGINVVNNGTEPLEKEKKYSTRYREKKERYEKEIKDTLNSISNLVSTNNLENRRPDREIKNNEAKVELIGKKLDDIYTGLTDRIHIEKGISKDVAYEKIKKYINNTYKMSELSDEDKGFVRSLNTIINNYKNKTVGYNMSDLDSRLKKVEEKLQYYQEKPYKDKYKDSAVFFTHFRNAIAHGNYTIDYSNAMRDGFVDYNKILFSFKNVDPTTHATVFEIKNIRGKRLKSLIEDFCKSVEKNAEFNDKSDMLEKNLIREALLSKMVTYSESERIYDQSLGKEVGVQYVEE
ncbi:MAG: hypothetical protein IJW20_07055 [Clostridia bacterium]|nr:hypothetical protein [Clostridia bacterium]